MSREIVAEGARACEAGRARTDNPYDASSPQWLAWRDGFDQARASENGRAPNPGQPTLPE